MKRRSAKQKGRSGQKEVVDLLKKYMCFTDDDVRSNPSSVTGEDIIFSSDARVRMPVSIEVKRSQKMNLSNAWEQTISNAQKYLPLLVFRRNNEDWKVCMNFEDFLMLYKIIDGYRREHDKSNQ